jgi:hypothetical protein
MTFLSWKYSLGIILVVIAVRAMTAAGAAAVTALEMVGRREDEVRAIHVEVFGLELWRLRWGGPISIHASIFVHRLRGRILPAPL